MADFRYSAGIDVNLNIKGASGQLQELQKQLQQISNMKVDIGTGNLTADIEKASEAAMKLSAHLATAMNPRTGNLDFTKFYTSIQKSGASLQEYGEALQRMGPAGQKAFVSLADSISKSEIPLKRTSQMVDKMWDGLKRTAGWQLQSSIIHGIMGSIQSAVGYAKDLNSSLNDIRIVTGQSTDQMAKFAKEANQAAKSLSTTTTDYTKASLIYYQQGLSDAEVKQRTEATIKMANVSGQSAEHVSSQMTAIWNNFDNGSKSLQYYGDVITALGAKTAASSEEIAQGIQKFAAISDTIGLSYEYAASALATVTATTRESADVVGNAYKTLFSRIQGLNLGETLDDGTTLNKYSTALAKVGISIKDSSGNLKDMDSILNEMGSKWETLSKDQQMGLAQTVAGVRQYTQLIALMDNWDTFQQNLQTAKSSSGTLDAQAAIYAESWEAASDRVRASWEGLWDTMINSDSMITMLDGLSGIIEAMDTLASSMGGAGGVLTSFLGVATKLFAPKLSQGLRDTAYNVAMLFGGEEKIKKARNAVLDNALKTLDTDSEFGDLYGQNEAEARRAAMKSQVQASLDYAENYDNMTLLQHQIEQQYANATKAQDQRVIEAGVALDNAKNAQFDARMNTYGSYGSGGEYSSLLERSQSLLADQAFNYMYDELGLDFQSPENQARINNAQKRQQEINASNDIIKTEKTGKVLGDFSSALIDFYKVASGEKGPDYLNKLTGAIDELEKTGYQSESKSDVLKRMREAAEKSVVDGVTPDYGKFYSELIQSQGIAAGGTEFGSFLSSWLEKSFITGMAQVDYDTEQKRSEGLRDGREKNLDGTKNVDWADTMVNASEAIMFALSAGQSLQELNTSIKKDDIAGTLTSLITGIGNFAMSLAGFKTLFSQFSKTASKAGKYAAIAATVSTLLIPGVEWISDIIKTEKELYNEQVLSANELSQIYAQNQNQHKILQASIQSYQDANKELMALSTNTDNWSNQLYNVNSAAIKLITDNNLVEGKDYSTTGGRYDIKNSALERIEKESVENLQSSKIISDMAQQNLAMATNEQQKQDIADNLLKILSPTVGESLLEIGGGLASFVGGLAKIGSSGIMTAIMGGTGGLTAPALAPLAYATAGAGLLEVTAGSAAMLDGTKNLDIRSNNKKELELAMEYFEINGLGVLTQSIDEIASTIQISTQTASILKESTGILTDWHNSIQANTEAQKLTTENAVRNIVSMNENINNLEKNDTILKGATEKYTKAVEQETKNLEDFNKKSATDKYALADDVKNVLGLDNLNNFHWTGDDSTKTQLTYSYLDGQGQIKEGAVSYNSIIAAKQNQAGMDAIDQYADDMADVYNKLQQNYDTDTTNGLFSMLAGDNFANATTKELDAAKREALKISNEIYSELAKLGDSATGFDSDIADYIQSKFGMDVAAFKELFNIDANTNLINWFRQFQNVTTSAQKLIEGEPLLSQWVGDNKTISDNLTQNTLTSLYDSFKKASLVGGEESGNAILDGITQVLSDSGLDESDYNAAVQGLLAIDWSNTLISGGAAAEIIRSLGGELNTTTGEWEAFAAAMAAAAGTIPDFSEIISQLTQLAGALQGLSKNGTVSADIRDQLVAMNPEFADLFSKNYSGDYTFIGNDNNVLKQATWDQILANKGQAKQIAQKYSDYVNGAGKEQKDNDNIGIDDFTSHYIPGVGYSVNPTHASQLGKIAGYDVQAQNNILNNYDTAKGALELWDTGKLTDIGIARQGKNGGFDLYNQETKEWENIVDTNDARYKQISNEFEADQSVYNTAKSEMDTMLSAIHGLDEVSGNWDSGEIESILSTMDSARDIFEASTKFDFLRDEHGALNDSTLKAIQAMPETSERASAAIDQLVASKENLYRVEQELHDALLNKEMTEEEAETAMDSAILAYEQAEANAALQSSIDAVAEARGLDAEAVAFYAEQIQESMSLEDQTRLGPSNIADMAADLAEQQEAITDLNEEWSKLSQNINQTEMTLDKAKALNSFADYIDKLTNSSLTAGKSVEALNKSWQQFKSMGGNMSKVLKGDIKEITKLSRAFGDMEKKIIKVNKEGKNYGKTYEQMFEQADDALKKLKNPKEESVLGPEDFLGNPEEQKAAYNDLLDAVYDTLIQEMEDNGGDLEAAADKVGSQFGVNIGKGVKEGERAEIGDGSADVVATPTDGEASNLQPEVGQPGEESWISWFCFPSLCGEHYIHVPVPGTATIPAPKSTAPKKSDLALTLRPDAPPKSSGGGGGGGGGGGAKEPKKVAIKRKSETVQRYKQNDYKASMAQKAKKSEEHQKDYLYGERKIEQLEKINRLTEKEAHIAADRIKESREYLIEDRQNLIKMLSKYGFEAEFDTDGFLANYEKVWNELYKEIAALYEDNLLTEEEEKIEEEYNIKLEEMEGALEDYENSLKELADDIEKYEESLFEMYDNKVEALEHKVEFKVELSEDDLEYLDFWIESLGDNIYNAIEAIEAMGAKANALFDGLETYQQGIMDIMSLSEDPLQVWATGGIEGILTQAQVDALRDNRDGLADYMQQLIDLRDEIKDKVLDTFDDWQEKLDSTLTTIEHYTSVLEHFKNMIDVVGKDSLGLSNQFMANLEQSAINQSLDSIDANKAYYDNLVEIQQEAQEKLEEARARGDQSSADHWEEVVQSTTEAMQDAQDALLTSLEDSLNLIAEQFEANMERAVETFNDALYAYGGLEGLSNDYDRIRENADLMAADYEKIYELSKINRNINKTLDDTKIIAGKQKLKSLQKEINDLQNSGVELSKYDLEYLQAKYELRLAEIELENAQNAKSTVRLSKDDEGNWSYIYTRNEEDIEESYQKYEDALYEMQKLSQEYLEEMSSTMLDTSSSMMEEIQNLRIQDFNSYEEYQKEIKHIQDKYAESLRLQENELNKAVSNSQQIYEQDWRNYNLITGYKISDSEKWADAFKESTIGQLLNSDSIVSSFSDTILGLTDILTKNLSNSAVSYFDNIDKAFASYGTSIEDFGKHVENTTEKISNKSKKAVEDAKTMASEMNDAFKEIAETVADWQEEFSLKIDEMLEKIKTLIQDINTAIETSAKYNKNNNGAENLIGSQEAIELLNKTGKFGQWSSDGSVGVKVDGKATNFVDYNAALIEEIDDAVARYANAKTGSSEREKYGEQLKELFKRYWEYRDIVNRVYDPTNLTTNMAAPTFTSMDTGGYTGEWGDFGKFAMLHEKELVLNKNDTKNFLDALNISREVINSMIEMNARQSSLALGDLMPMSIQDTPQILEQSVTIQAEFPNATDHNEIEEAFNNLINTASQYANRYND